MKSGLEAMPLFLLDDLLKKNVNKKVLAPKLMLVNEKKEIFRYIDFHKKIILALFHKSALCLFTISFFEYVDSLTKIYLSNFVSLPWKFDNQYCHKY